MEIVNITKNELRSISASYESYEIYLKSKEFEVKHLIRAHRGDWGDDGGWVISISSRRNKWYLIYQYISYNLDLGDILHDIETNNDVSVVEIYKTYNECLSSLNSTYNSITLDILENISDGWDDHNEYNEETNLELTKTEFNIFSIIGEPTHEYYTEDMHNIHNIENLLYTPNSQLNGVGKEDTVVYYTYEEFTNNDEIDDDDVVFNLI